MLQASIVAGGLSPSTLLVKPASLQAENAGPPKDIAVPRPSPWPEKILVLLRAGNPSATIEQIKVAASVRDLNVLKKAMASAQFAGCWPDVDRGDRGERAGAVGAEAA